MKGYLKSKDIKRLLCIKQHTINNLVNKSKKIKPLQLTKNPNPLRANRHYTQDDLRKIGRILHGELYTKVFTIHCPHVGCKKPIQITFSDIILQQLEDKDGIKRSKDES